MFYLNMSMYQYNIKVITVKKCINMTLSKLRDIENIDI